MNVDVLTPHKVEHLIALSEGLYELKELFFQHRLEEDFKKVFQLSNPLISICVATCDRAPLLVDRCLKSLLSQTYQNIQIIVVGDNCIDDTEYLLGQIRDSRITFENLSTRGPYPRPGRARWCVAGTTATNRAIDLSEGAFICHLDDDDEATPDRIEKLVTAALSEQLEFIWHKFYSQQSDSTWSLLGTTELQVGQVTTGSIFYHRYFSRIKWDVYAFRQQEPGDWNRIRKIKFLEPKMKFLDEVLTIHYREQAQVEFSPRENEKFIEL